MIGIDTNVLVRFIVADDAQRQSARQFLRSLTPEQPGFVTQVTLAELHWVLSRAYKFDRTACLATLRDLVMSDSLEFDDGEGVVRALALADAGADFADALIQGAMELFGIGETVTFDRQASQRLGWTLLT